MILINTRVLLRERATGVERYTREVVKRLPGVRTLHPHRRLDGWAGHLWEQIALPAQVKKHDLLWSPANTGPWMIPNQVVTIHDLSAIEHPEWFTPAFGWWYRLLLPRLVTRVRRVITVSEFSRTRICARWGLPHDQVIAIPPGVDRGTFYPHDAGPVRQRLGLPETYVLAVGSLEPRKNLGPLRQAWSAVWQRFPQARLVIVGAPGNVFRRGSDLSESSPGVVSLGYVPDADLPALYSGASILLMPSRYEGFGLPVLEAMACGAPVIASHAGGLPEALGYAGRLVPPSDSAAWTAAIEQLLSDDALRAALRLRGLARAAEFSWEQTARQVQEVLHGA